VRVAALVCFTIENNFKMLTLMYSCLTLACILTLGSIRPAPSKPFLLTDMSIRSCLQLDREQLVIR
jgi:hypothetical protein